MTLTNQWKRKAGTVLLFLLGFVVGYFLRDRLIPLGIILEQVQPWLLGYFINQMIVLGILLASAAVLYRYRRYHYLVSALGWGIWSGFLAVSLLLLMLLPIFLTGGITP